VLFTKLQCTFATPALLIGLSLAALSSVQLHYAIFFLVPWEKVGARKRATTESKHVAEHWVESQNRWTSTYCQGEGQWNLGA